ncbi:hypothetical protein ACTFIV_000583 [Dictyostelium citrinum]
MIVEEQEDIGRSTKRFQLVSKTNVYTLLLSVLITIDNQLNITFINFNTQIYTCFSINYILTKSGNREIKWDIKVLNHLEIEANANLIAILMEAIWKRRNKFIHEKVTIKIHKELIIHELKKTQMAVWEKTKSNIEKRIRIMNKDLEDNEHKHIQIISKSLQKYSKQWNSPLLKTRLPEHLKQFITSINTLYE